MRNWLIQRVNGHARMQRLMGGAVTACDGTAANLPEAAIAEEYSSSKHFLSAQSALEGICFFYPADWENS